MASVCLLSLFKEAVDLVFDDDAMEEDTDDDLAVIVTNFVSAASSRQKAVRIPYWFEYTVPRYADNVFFR